MDKKPNKTYKHKGYNVSVYYENKPHEQAIKEMLEIKTNEYIKKLAKAR